MVNRLYNKQVSPKGYMKGGRIKKMGGGSANGKPISKSKNAGLAKMAQSPKGKEANWIPTDPERKFFLLFRFYGAKPQIFTKEWQLNDLVEAK